MEPEKSLSSRAGAATTRHPSGKNYLLVIGIDRYKNGIPSLYNAVKDARTFKQLLQEQYQFEPDCMQELLDENATKDAIVEAFDQLMHRLTDQDNLIFYYSGHGEYYQPIQRGYWIPSDAHLERRTTYISNADIVDYIKVMKARHVVGIVDSCFSAALFAQKKLRPETSRQFSLPSRYLITAGRLEPVSDGSMGDNSPFAKSLLDQLRYNDKDHIWVSELAYKVVHGTQYNSDKQLPQGEPLQNVGHQGGEFVFLRKGGVVPPSREPEPETVISQPETNRNIEPEPSASAPTPVPRELPQLKRHFKTLSAKNLEKALEDLQALLAEDSYMINDFILLSAQFNQLKGDMRRGIIPYSDSTVRQNQIIASFQSLVDDLGEEDVRVPIED